MQQIDSILEILMGRADVDMPLKDYVPHRRRSSQQKATSPIIEFRRYLQSQTSPILSLPLEIRDMIYSCLFTPTCIINIGLVRPVNKQKDKRELPYFKFFRSTWPRTQSERYNFLSLYEVSKQLRTEVLDFLLANVIIRPIDGVYFEHLSRTMRTDVPEYLRPRIQRARIEDGSAVPRLLRTPQQDMLSSLLPLGFTGLKDLYVRDAFTARWTRYLDVNFQPNTEDRPDWRGTHYELSRWKVYRDAIEETVNMKVRLQIQSSVSFPRNNDSWETLAPMEVLITGPAVTILTLSKIDGDGEKGKSTVEIEAKVPWIDQPPTEDPLNANPSDVTNSERQESLEESLRGWIRDRTKLLNAPLQKLRAAKIPHF